jgi:ABC-2 type transport system permease protein
VSLQRTAQVLRKDLALGPRSPILVWALVIPIVITLLVRGVFGDLFTSDPRLVLVDRGDSALAAAIGEVAGVELSVLDDAAELRAEVADGRYDAGLVLPAGFDDALRAGEHPPLELLVAGESRPADRAVLLATILDLVRDLSGTAPPVDVEVVVLGETLLPIDLRLLPLLVLYAVAIPGGMVPASSLVEEKERGTLAAILATPTSVGEVLLAKGALGVLLGVVAGVVTLTMNAAFGAAPGTLLLTVTLGAVMMALVGLLLGSWAPDTNTLFAAWKGAGIVLFLPALFFIWPGLPLWPARLMPAYYFLHPAFAVSVEGASFGDVAAELAIGAAICVALVPAVVAVGRWLERRLVTGRVASVTAPQPAASPAA